MAEDRSLDDFAAADGDADESAESGTDDAESDPEEDPADADDAVDAADAPDVDDRSDVDPAVATSTWHADGTECDRCGERVERRWREADAFVCADCASW
ncbi:hypothetical protein DVK05_08885 [Halorubrum sp. Atlit-8R]|uniref:DUF7573 domain-containing protein n=1 Tax=unclassified Halorubrum TaxID=2642239 RepID=UPI000EF1B8B1|nr:MULTISPECIES: hypothetical protein [unclassified Halorubrum]RLM67935.1 hypothetical protein DVK08_09270 [Halorubrum sp. Atlit-9R]RLM81105.1 hypothetical protein DVK05_08885 [Halorubrum sp. Atlit-8R]